MQKPTTSRPFQPAHTTTHHEPKQGPQKMENIEQLQQALTDLAQTAGSMSLLVAFGGIATVLVVALLMELR